MSTRRELEQQASKMSKKIENFLENNTNLKIHRVARQGSRKDGTHRDDSDQDIVFAISDNPDEKKTYEELRDKLKNQLGVDAELGSHGKVLNIKKGDLDVDLKLLKTEEFDKQLSENKIKRKSVDK